MIPRARVLPGRIVHPSTVEVDEVRCHAGAEHGNAQDRGIYGAEEER